jgi:hypothetical protein
VEEAMNLTTKDFDNMLKKVTDDERHIGQVKVSATLSVFPDVSNLLNIQSCGNCKKRFSHACSQWKEQRRYPNDSEWYPQCWREKEREDGA